MKPFRAAALLLAAALAAVLAPAPPPARAELTGAATVQGELVGGFQVAASSYLCTGYTSCAQRGYPHAGYQAVSGTQFWRMTAGHNCTNYAAYRMVQNGMSNTRPWAGTGNAYNWGPANAGRRSATPRVGAVAWWKANVKGAGRLGHVAYVERVVSADEIIISEDNWGGNFHWRRVKRSSGWPSGFLSFAPPAAAPVRSDGSPKGKVDRASSPRSHRLLLKGWAFDPDQAKKYVYIRVYVGGRAGVGQRIELGAAKRTRSDVAKAYPGAGKRHGFSKTVKVKKSGKQTVYVYGMNKRKTPGTSTLLRQIDVTIRR